MMADRPHAGRPPRPGSIWSSHLNNNVGVLYASYAGLSILLCAQLSESSDALLRFASLLEAFIPSIRNLSEITLFPTAARKTFALLWSTAPLVTVAAVLLPGTFRPDIEKLRRNPWLWPVGLAALLLPAWAFAHAPASVSDLGGRLPHQRVFTVVHDSRVLFGAMAGLMVGAAAISLGYGVRIAHLAIRVFSQRRQT